MRFSSCGFPLGTLLTPSQTNAAKTSKNPLPWWTVSLGLCSAPGSRTAKESKGSARGCAPRETESSHPGWSRGCERGSRPQRRLLRGQRALWAPFQPRWRYWSAGTTAAKGTLAGQQKAPPSFKGSPLHPSHQGNDAFRSFWVTFRGIQQQERANAALRKHHA